jgi:hypothetical protein
MLLIAFGAPCPFGVGDLRASSPPAREFTSLPVGSFSNDTRAITGDIGLKRQAMCYPCVRTLSFADSFCDSGEALGV